MTRSCVEEHSRNSWKLLSSFKTLLTNLVTVLVLKICSDVCPDLCPLHGSTVDLSTDRMRFPVHFGSSAPWHSSRLAASVSEVCGSSADKLKSERLHPRAPSLPGLWPKSRKGGSCSCRQDSERRRRGPADVPSGHICFPLWCAAPGAPRSACCTLQSILGCFRRMADWSRRTRRWQRERCGSSGPPCSSWNAPDPLCPKSATGEEATWDQRWAFYPTCKCLWGANTAHRPDAHHLQCDTWWWQYAKTTVFFSRDRGTSQLEVEKTVNLGRCSPSSMRAQKNLGWFQTASHE